MRSFYTLVITQTLSLIGSRMTSVGVGIYLFKTTGAATPLLMLAFFNELPGMLGGSLAGVWVDRWDRRKVMLFADLGQALGSALLIGLFLTGRFQLWQLYLIAFIQGIFSIFQGPAEDAAITMLVPENQRERANALREMAFPFAGVIAPVLAGLVYAAAGIAGVLSIDLVSFLAAVIALAFITIPQPTASMLGEASRGSFRREIAAGFSFLAAASGLLILVIYSTFTSFLLNGPIDLAIPYLMIFTGSEAGMGGYLGLMSLGAFSGALLITLRPNIRPRMGLLLGGMLLNGVMFLVFGAARSPWVFGIALFLLMLPLPVSNALFISIIQLKTPADLQGRIFSIVEQLGYLGSTFSFFLTGYLVDHVLNPPAGVPAWIRQAPVIGSQFNPGMRLVMIVAGLLMLAATTLVAAWPRVRELETRLPDYKAIPSVELLKE